MDPKSVPNGGPAFPVADPFHMQPGTVTEAARLAGGMSLRDYFAAHALTVFGAGGMPSTAARLAYEWADAMLKAREA